MQRFAKLLLLFLFLYLGLIVYANRALYFSVFDEPYWKDKYEHSQWKLPLSVRTLGDDGLYLYEGYRLIRGGDPTLLNAEVPPLGKYLIGASTRVFGNGHWYGLIVNTLVIITLFALGTTLFGSRRKALVIASLVAIDPLITSQFPLTMLDSLQLLFLLLTFYLVTRIPAVHREPKTRASWICGIVLAAIAFGLFSETKFPILGLPVAILVALFLWQATRSVKTILLFFAVSALAYLLPYIHYFFLGHSFWDWLGVQKWIASFYAHANLTPNVGSSTTTLMSGWYRNLFTGSWVYAAEWSPVWAVVAPLALVSSVITLWKISKRKENIAWLPVAGFSLFSFVFFAVIPFWVRYLVLPLPFSYIMTGKLLFSLRKKSSVVLLTVMLGVNTLTAMTILFPTPGRMLTQLSYDWENGFFHDIYEHTTRTLKTQTRREQFRRFGQKAFSDAEIEHASVAFDTQSLTRFASVQRIPARVTYFTRHLGAFTQESTVTVVKERGAWRVLWTWDTLISGLSENTKLVTRVEEAVRGSILASDKKPLAEDGQSVLLWATPGELDKSKEEDLLKLLWNLFDHRIAHIAFHQRIVGNTQPDIPVPLGVIYKPLTEELQKELLGFPGLTLTPHRRRRYGTSNIVPIGKVANSK